MVTIKNIGLSVATVLLLSACGSDSDSSAANTNTNNNSTATETGTFIDAPVQGLTYTTATQSGYTDENGTFKYKNGEMVEFKLGDLVLGSVTAGTMITPYEISDNNTTAENIMVFLQNLDANKSNGNALDLSKLKETNAFTGIDLTNSDFNITKIISDRDSEIGTLIDSNTTRISKENALSNYKDFIKNNSIKFNKKFTDEYLKDKTFYALYNWKDKPADADKWTLVKEQFDGKNHTFNEYNQKNNSYGSDEVEAYTISNGIITVFPSDGNGNYTQLVSSIDEDKITITSKSDSGITLTEYFYFDEEKAKDKLVQLKLLSNGFTESYLNGKIFYGVLNWKDSKTASDNFISAQLNFNSNGTVNHINSPDGNFTENYTVSSNGLIQNGTSFDWEIISVTDKVIIVNKINHDSKENRYDTFEEYFYFNKQDAKDKINSL